MIVAAPGVSTKKKEKKKKEKEKQFSTAQQPFFIEMHQFSSSFSLT